MFMAVYGVSPYAMPKEVALGCMMNMRTAQSWKALPMMLSIGGVFGSKHAIAELNTAFHGNKVGSNGANEILQELKLGIHDI